MQNNPFDSIQSRVQNLLQAKGLQNLENPLAQILRQGLQEMEFVSLEEFEIQREILNRLRTKVHALEARIAQLEAERERN